MFRFKENNSLDKRISEVKKIVTRWPGRIPIILERSRHSRLEEFDKCKFLCPNDYTVQQFLGCLRKKIKMSRDKALFVFVNGSELVSGDTAMAQVYDSKKDEDGFIYMIYSEQEVLGIDSV